MENVLDSVLEVCRKIENSRTLKDIFMHLVSEVGELGQEIEIHYNPDHYKKAGKDGVIGEAIDVILCAVDTIYKYDESITKEDIMNIINNKLEKWQSHNLPVVYEGKE